MKKDKSLDKKINCNKDDREFVSLVYDVSSILENTFADSERSLEDGKTYYVRKMFEILPDSITDKCDNNLGIFFGSPSEIVPQSMFSGEFRNEFSVFLQDAVYLLMQILDQDNQPFGGLENDLVLQQDKFVEHLGKLKSGIQSIKEKISSS